MTVSELASLGGQARARKLSRLRRKEIASQAARSRWVTKNKKNGDGGTISPKVERRNDG